MDSPLQNNGGSAGIARIEVEGLHGRYSIRQDFSSGLNVLYGKNGSGKTTLLHILANLLERDIERFFHIRFDRILLVTAGGSKIQLTQSRSDSSVGVTVSVDQEIHETISRETSISPAFDKLLRERLGGRPVYLPAFRAVLEDREAHRARSNFRIEDEHAQKHLIQIIEREFTGEHRSGKWASPTSRRRERAEVTAIKTGQCRRWFGEFVPVIRYPSLRDVEDTVRDELADAFFHLTQTDQQILSNVFLGVLDAVVRVPSSKSPAVDPRAVLMQIQSDLQPTGSTPVNRPAIYQELEAFLEKKDQMQEESRADVAGILRVYANAFMKRREVERAAFKTIDLFLDSVNRFLDGKQLAAATEWRAQRPLSINGRSEPLSILSSGERHVLTLLFAATHMTSEDGLVLIDEPELSLHVDWQRIILSELLRQTGDRQVIACTHAPEVGADHVEQLRDLNVTSTPSSGTGDYADFLE